MRRTITRFECMQGVQVCNLAELHRIARVPFRQTVCQTLERNGLPPVDRLSVSDNPQFGQRLILDRHCSVRILAMGHQDLLGSSLRFGRSSLTPLLIPVQIQGPIRNANGAGCDGPGSLACDVCVEAFAQCGGLPPSMGLLARKPASSASFWRDRPSIAVVAQCSPSP